MSQLGRNRTVQRSIVSGGRIAADRAVGFSNDLDRGPVGFSN
jgi:hypothetical protein